MSIFNTFPINDYKDGQLYFPCTGREMDDEVTTALDITTSSSFIVEKGSILFIIPPKYTGVQRKEIAYQPFTSMNQTNSAGWTISYTYTGNLSTGNLYKVFDGDWNTYTTEANMIPSYGDSKKAFVTIDFGGPLYSIKKYMVHGCCARVRLDGIKEDGTKVYLSSGQTPTYYSYTTLSVNDCETYTQEFTSKEVFKGVYLEISAWSSSQDYSIIKGIDFVSEEALSIEKTTYTQPHLFINDVDTGIIPGTLVADKGYCLIYNGINWDLI